MDSVTQQNAALVEEAAAASESMQDQAKQLEDLVSVFKLEQSSGAQTRSHAFRPSGQLTAARAAPTLRLA